MQTKQIGLILLLLLLGFGLITQSIPFTSNQFFEQVTDLNYLSVFNGDFNNQLLFIDGNKISAFDFNILDYNINVDLTDYVPFTGADQDVDLGANDLSAKKLTAITTGSIGTDVQGGVNINLVEDPSASVVTKTATTGGSMSEGTYYYRVGFVTALGVTHGMAQGSIVLASPNNAVQLDNIPISTDPRVTGRIIYRSTSIGISDWGFILTTINDNTTTSYLDVTNDSGLTGAKYTGTYSPNTTNNYITVDGDNVMLLDRSRTQIGYGTGTNLAGDSFVTLVGHDNFLSATSPSVAVIVGSRNFKNATGNNLMAFGDLSGSDNTSGSTNYYFGSQAGRRNLTGSYNIGFGDSALTGVYGNSHSYNHAFGHNSLRNITTGSYNTTLGYYSGDKLTSGSYNSFLGSYAGYNANQKTDAIYSTAIGYESYTDASYQMDLGGTRIQEILLGRSDNVKVYRGAGKDAVDYFDGTTWNFELSSGDFVFSGGNVGIGTTSPDEKLGVNGNVKASGALSLGTNTQSDLSSGDINASTIYYDVLTAKSPIILCSEDWCSVDLPQAKESYYLKKDSNWNVLEITDKSGKTIESKEFVWENDFIVDSVKLGLKEVFNKTKRLRDDLKAEKEKQALIDNCLKQGFEWDGTCFELIKQSTTYNLAVEKVPVYETIINDVNYSCVQLDENLKAYETTCVQEEEIVNDQNILDYSFEFRENCGWEEEIGYYCENRIKK